MSTMLRPSLAACALVLGACAAPAPPPPAPSAAQPAVPPVASAAPAHAPAAPKAETHETAPAHAKPDKPQASADAAAKPRPPETAKAKAPAPAKPKTPEPAKAEALVASAAPAPAAKPAAAPAPAPLDLKSLEQRLKETSAIGVLTKISLKNQVDDLIEKFHTYHQGVRPPTLSDLRPTFELLLMKVLSLLQDHDPGLAHDINTSREAIWGVLSDPRKLAQYS